MSKKNIDINSLLEQLENFTFELANFEEYYKKLDLDIINNKLNNHDDKINSLTHNMRNLNEIIDKNREYVLLELESYLDKHKQIQLKNDELYNDLIFLLKRDSENNFSLLNEEIGKLKQIIIQKDNLIGELKNIEVESDNKIKLLSEKVDEIVISKDTEINKLREDLNNEINVLSVENRELSSNLVDKDNQNKYLSDENNFMRLTMVEKDSQINSLKEEILILKSIIKEKDETLDLNVECD